MSKVKILFLYLKTGGGHLSAAKALHENLRKRYPDSCTPFLLDPVPRRRTPITVLLENGYRFVSNKAPKLWILIFETAKLKPVRKVAERLISISIRKKVTRFILKEKITTIVVLHFLLINPVVKIVRKRAPEVRVMTVVTDPFTAHPFWFSNSNIETVVFSETLRHTAITEHGIPPRNIHRFPIILRGEFGKPLSRKQIEEKRRSYGFDPGKAFVLIAGGGEGLARAVRIVRAFITARFDGSVCVVCGHDRESKRKINKLAANARGMKTVGGKNGKPHIRAYGYVDFMSDLMNSADVVISKGGPATIIEALMLRKPLLITRYLYGQERGNIDFILRNRVGFYRQKPQEIVAATLGLLTNPTRFNRYKKRIEGLELKIGTNEISDYIVSRSQF